MRFKSRVTIISNMQLGLWGCIPDQTHCRAKCKSMLHFPSCLSWSPVYAVHLFQPALETGRYKSAVQKDKGRSVYSVWECICKLRFALVQTNQVCWGFHLMLLFSKPTSGRKFSDLITAHGILMWHFDYFYLGNITNKYIRPGWPTSARLKSGF